MTNERINAFSDGVIAIIITIMVLELKVPHGADLAALSVLLPVFLTYVLSFIVIVPVPEVLSTVLNGKYTLSAPGLTTSFWRSTSRLAPAAKVMLPLKLIVSSPASPLIVRFGNVPVNAPTLAMSSPPP